MRTRLWDRHTRTTLLDCDVLASCSHSSSCLLCEARSSVPDAKVLGRLTLDRFMKKRSGAVGDSVPYRIAPPEQTTACTIGV